MTSGSHLIKVFCTATNAVKRTGLSSQSLDVASYLGGDLGIDSIEMLEIWFRMEKELGLRLPDDAKRDIYTVTQVIEVFERRLGAAASQAQ